MKRSSESAASIAAAVLPANPPEGSYRSWAARMADRATTERDASEAERLMSIAVYWERLANAEDWRRDGAFFGCKA